MLDSLPSNQLLAFRSILPVRPQQLRAHVLAGSYRIGAAFLSNTRTPSNTVAATQPAPSRPAADTARASGPGLKPAMLDTKRSLPYPADRDSARPRNPGCE